MNETRGRVNETEKIIKSESDKNKRQTWGYWGKKSERQIVLQQQQQQQRFNWEKNGSFSVCMCECWCIMAQQHNKLRNTMKNVLDIKMRCSLVCFCSWYCRHRLPVTAASTVVVVVVFVVAKALMDEEQRNWMLSVQWSAWNALQRWRWRK